ncbi:MAG TPA: [FeFe] hydrogenase H-cluster radical SAM maturase HydG, partial [Bacillota bacterium]|nr:[FeFe] hydrogenase H-cluster radical SAM maturase HydG [Bacillota bacterium]
HCGPNALSSCMEYLLDYASPATRQVGEQLVSHELNAMETPLQQVGRQLVEKVKDNKRDVYV